MENNVRYTKTTKGIDEIGLRQYNLTGKLRIMLILVDPSKTEEQLRAQGAQIGAPADSLEAMVRDGYIAPVQPVATGVGTAALPVNGTPVTGDGPALASAKANLSGNLEADLLALRLRRSLA